MPVNTCTQRLGDTIHAYAITLGHAAQSSFQAHFRVRAEYANLFISSTLHIVPSLATHWRHDGSFSGPRHGQHVRDTMAASAGISDADLAVCLPMPCSSHAKPGRYIVICPHTATHATYKEWPLERWAAICETIASLGLRALVCGMPGRERLKLPASATALTLGAVELGSLLAGAMALAGPDSGHIHLADTMGTPVIGLYAATSSSTYGPYSDNHHCIDRHHDAFPNAMTYDSSRHVRRSCMQIIDVDTVAERIASVWRAPPQGHASNQSVSPPKAR